MDKQWNKAKLGDYIEINPKEILKKGTIAKKISMDKLQPFCKDVPDYEMTEFTGGAKFRNGDTIMARITPCLENGKTAMVNVLDKDEIGFGSTEYIVFRSKTGLTDEQFVYYLVCSPMVREPAIKSMVGSSGRQRVQTDVVSNLEISFPPLDVQRNIGNILKTIDDRITLNNQINENLQQQAQALFTQCYEQADVSVPFTDLIQVLGGGTPKTGEASYWNGEIPFFTPKDVGTPYTLTTEKTITQSGLEHCNSRLYPVNTVFVTARGTVGKVGLAGVPMAMNQSCYALTGKSISPLLTYHYTLMTVAHLKHKASGAVFDAIITRDFETETVKKLSDTLAEQFVAVASPIYECILNNTLESQRLADLRNALLPKLMSGELDASDIEL